mmetsp:Transcript_4895/g.9966  ORF Transcript_4895/g.9966 Transcript_4895/m.9966 type:complete len:170 (-) Transcript_4895:21-530(-)
MPNASLLSIAIERHIEECVDVADHPGICDFWLQKLWATLDEVQESIVEINFACKKETPDQRQRLLAQLHHILHKCQELLRALQVLARYDPATDTDTSYATFFVEIDAVKHEASDLLEKFCEPCMTNEGSLNSFMIRLFGSLEPKISSYDDGCKHSRDTACGFGSIFALH